MNPNQSSPVDAQALARDHEVKTDLAVHEAEPVPSAEACPRPVDNDPSPSERLYEAYRLWAFTGR
jgi:hypothetical protein